MRTRARACHGLADSNKKKGSTESSPSSQPGFPEGRHWAGQDTRAQSRVRSGPLPGDRSRGGAAGGVSETCPHGFQHVILPPHIAPPLSLSGLAKQTDVGNIWASVVGQQVALGCHRRKDTVGVRNSNQELTSAERSLPFQGTSPPHLTPIHQPR